MDKWMGVMKHMGSVDLAYGEVNGVMRYVGKCILVYGEMDVSNGLVRIMMWQHGKMEKWLGREKLEREKVACAIHTCACGTHLQKTLQYKIT